MINNGGIKGSWCQLSLLVSALLGRLQRGTRAHPSAMLLSHPFPFPSTSFEPLSSAQLLSSQWLYCARLKSNHHYPFLTLPPDLHSISASQAFCLQFSFFFPVALVSRLCHLFFFFFMSGARSSSRVPAVTPAAIPPLPSAKLWFFISLMSAEQSGRRGKQIKYHISIWCQRRSRYGGLSKAKSFDGPS